MVETQLDSEAPKIIIIAGANGAGKTTFAREYLPNEAHCPVFVNADLIAAGLSPFAPDTAAITAGRLMLQMLDDLTTQRKSFAFETTLSGKSYAQKIKHWHTLGYHVKLIFLELPDAETAVKRVAYRVSQGGHNIPEETIRRRFVAGLNNFHQLYKPLVDAWLLFDSSDTIAKLIDWSE
ncbi:MAG: zeta toxin family protein [Gammaproteobacteria bacterium]|nr:zeta toxin family protein [Gammaproteobacteria bacterium]